MLLKSSYSYNPKAYTQIVPTHTSLSSQLPKLLSAMLTIYAITRSGYLAKYSHCLLLDTCLIQLAAHIRRLLAFR